MPRASTATAATVKLGAFQSCRNAKRKSFIIKFPFVGRFCETPCTAGRLTQAPYNSCFEVLRSFGAERLHGIDARCAQGGNETGQRGDPTDEERDAAIEQWIARAYFEE